jgi:GPI ethanolamine phosphate transferase 3 subunit O
MGDDTWTTVYPTSFAPNMTFPFDSFNVEDLHSVDEGVIHNLFPLLEENATSRWDLLIGHFLGVDHVGHRLGPAHPTMATKLKQMNDTLARVVESLDDRTLLVVMGDHGMDRKGDHGGDGDHETSAATWIYSKYTSLASGHITPPQSLATTTTFPGAPLPHRSIQQIDLVPTLSLLLGLPIPFNNLGTVIPELFCRGNNDTILSEALRLNANQVKDYFEAYRSSPSGGELDSVWNQIERSWASTLDSTGEQKVLAMHNFTRLALASCRSLWAQFNVVLMCVGLFALALGSAAVWALYTSLGCGVQYWEANGWAICARTGLASFGGAVVGATSWAFIPGTANFFGYIEAVLTGAALASSTTILLSTTPSSSFTWRLGPLSIPLILHALAFLSNSFTFWEDRILTFLLMTSLVPFVLCAFMYPQAEARLRHRILVFSTLFAGCLRLITISTVCREEQHPYCHVTFYASSSLPSPPLLILLISLPMSLTLPSVVRRFMAISASDKGPAPMLIEWGLRLLMLVGNALWMLEWLESNEVLGLEWEGFLRAARSGLVLVAIGHTIVGGTLWWYLPLCLEVHTSVGPSGKKEMQVIGYANSYGSSFLLFLLVLLCPLFVVTQLTGQIILALSVIALLAISEVFDSARDVRLATKVQADEGTPTIMFSEIAPVALLAMQTFYATGHQSTMSTIQWKTAFLMTRTLWFPVSPILVILNSFGPQLFFAAAVPLLTTWNVGPLIAIATKPSADHRSDSAESSNVQYTSSSSWVLMSSLRACLGISFYFSVLLLSSAASSAWLRRHLMVWKVFAPRFMTAGATVLAVDIGVMLGMALGVGRVVQKVERTFQQLM